MFLCVVQVEGGRIDHAHHDTIAHRALDETVAFDEAIELAYQMTNQQVRRRGTPSCIAEIWVSV